MQWRRLDSEGPARREHIIDCKRLRASARTSPAQLGLRSGDPVLQVRRVLAFTADVPTILEDIWLPGGPFKGLTAERLAALSRHDVRAV